jgi:hypothetical protein
MRRKKLRGDGPRVHVWWCDLGCGAEIISATPGMCPKCDRRMVDLGWRAGDHRAVFVYYSTQEGAA